MSIIRTKLVIAAVATGSLFCLTSSFSKDFTEVVAIAKQSIVKILPIGSTNLGTGFFVDDNGRIVTCAHVLYNEPTDTYIDSCRAINTADLFDGETGAFIAETTITYIAVIDTIIPEYDFALLKADIRKAGIKQTSFLPIGNSDSLREGEEVAVLGYLPERTFLRARPVLAKGIISTIRRQEETTAFQHNKIDLIQLDLYISKGMSGAPVFSARKGVVGYIDMGIFHDTSTQTAFAIAIAIDQVKHLFMK